MLMKQFIMQFIIYLKMKVMENTIWYISLYIFQHILDRIFVEIELLSVVHREFVIILHIMVDSFGSDYENILYWNDV